ncbi:endo-1,4-beta-xylanase [Prevotella copri]|uniref:endo-1,4-beta-xylanase n=1 Tax=Segatella copri TaxID=165179 RepID=A0A6G1U2R3_9BACT|nr:endo-1,4-beta-xylanase [Segatella copri]MQN81459.1 endo-1,4-beta-xylanase [Segatella copri]
MKLKNINLGLGLMTLLALSSCADDKFSEYRTDMTKNLKDYQYLNNYEPLKKYVEDMKAAGKCNPDFKLGIALGAADFNKQELVYCLAGSNFNEMTAGNAMKMASCVKDDGSMDFSTVKEFVKNAQDADMTIYGHTLAWHSQAANKYLNNLIKDKELPPDPTGGNKYLEIACGDAGANPWDKQISYKLPKALVKGQRYVMSVKVKASDVGTFAAWPIWEASDNKNQWGGSNDVQYMATYDISEDYSTLTWEFTANFPIDKLQFVFGKVGGTISCDDFTLTKAGSDENLIENGDFAKESASGWNPTGCTIKVASAAAAVDIPVSVGHLTFDDGQNLGGWGMDNAPKIVNGVCEVGNNAAKENPWNAQVNYEPGFAFENGKTYHLKMKIKGSVAGEFGAGFQNPDGYKGCGDFPTIKVTTDWKEVDVATTCNGDNALRLLLNIGKYAGTLHIDDFEVYYMKSANSIPLTDEEKKSLLTDAMGKWIDGMMEATDGYVTSWDVVNEALSGADKDGDGKFDLQSAKRGNVSAADAKNNFYWQDYLGDIDYVRTAVAAARKSFAAHNGDPEKLKLFINDYNLESDWDDNGKLKSLIQWIHDWEADGVTKIDGIGTQMHISCYADPNTQKSKKDHIVKMLELMAKSGKLCKISELDMGYVDAAGKEVKTVDMTEEQHKEMRDLYTFVLQKYFEIIPIDKQYGITQWCATDAPKDSGWRPGLPVGLWDLNYLRKHTYAGFAVGLGAPEYWKEAK